MVRFDASTPDSPFKTTMLARVSPTGRVPVLVDDGFAVWDTLAIAEYLAETLPRQAAVAARRRRRGRARAASAPRCTRASARCAATSRMNIEAVAARGRRARAARASPACARDLRAHRRDVERSCSKRSGGPFLFGELQHRRRLLRAGRARASRTYGLPVPPRSRARYVERVLALPGVHAWEREALAEHDFLAVRRAVPHAPNAR